MQIIKINKNRSILAITIKVVADNRYEQRFKGRC
jgi:hypothetical protein